MADEGALLQVRAGRDMGDASFSLRAAGVRRRWSLLVRLLILAAAGGVTTLAYVALASLAFDLGWGHAAVAGAAGAALGAAFGLVLPPPTR